MHGSADSRLYRFAIEVLCKYVSKSAAEGIVQFVKFCMVGCTNVAVNLAVYYLLIFLGADCYAANTVGYFAGLVNAYVWNVRWVFHRNSCGRRAVVKFIAVYLFTYFLGMGILYLSVEILGISKVIAPLINVAVTTPINFFLHKYWSFGREKG